MQCKSHFRDGVMRLGRLCPQPLSACGQAYCYALYKRYPFAVTGTLTNKNITNTPVAFAMQKYYEEPASGADHGKALFNTISVTGGIRFDRTDVATNLKDAKGWQLYFQNYLNTLTLAEHQIVERLLPATTDCFIQAVSVSMSATADDNEWRLAA